MFANNIIYGIYYLLRNEWEVKNGNSSGQAKSIFITTFLLGM